ncbi:MAG: efflux RND transporter periplasmic adaptor subunit [Acidobacteriota bacterium]
MPHSRRFPTPRLTRAVVALTAVTFAAGCATQAQSDAGTPRPPRVAVAAAERQDVPLETTVTGRVEPVHRVDLRPRVGGALEAVLFREGAPVRAGTPLFRIDTRPYVIVLRRAEADVAAIEAQLTRARDEFARAERLAAADAVSTEEVDRRRSEVASLRAQLDAARAAAADAGLRLEWTTVRAPVSGTMGRAQVTIGNLVSAGPEGGTSLAVLQSLDPVHVYFDLDPATAARARTAGPQAWRATVTPFEGGPALEGPVDFVDSSVGAHTGTLKVRARISNPSARLLPSAVVRVVFRYGIARNVTMVPEVAIGADQDLRYVLVAGEDGTVERRRVAPGVKVGAWRAVLDDAVRPGDQVVLPGLPGLRPGMQVTPEPEVVR